MKPKIIYQRQLFQIFGLLFLAAIPLFDLFRLDLGNKQFLLLGQRFFVHQMYLTVIFFVLATLILVFFSKLFGRIWCGWLCPQNTWAELGDFFLVRFRKKKKNLADIMVLIGFVIGVFSMILVLSFIIMAFFIDPKELWRQISSGNIGGFVAISVVKLTVFGIVNMLVIRHSFCWNICPYAMMQRFLATKDTLRMVFDPATCIDCKRCEQVCTMKLMPRNLDETDDVTSCINCGECIKACNIQAARNNTVSSIAYSFGKEGKALNTMVNLDLRTILTGILFLLLTIGLMAGFITHQGLDISLNNELREEATMEDEWITNYYILKLRSTNGHTTPLKLEVPRLGDEGKIDPEIFYPSGETEELIRISVKAKAETLNTPLLPIDILINADGEGSSYSSRIKASFYNIGY